MKKLVLLLLAVIMVFALISCGPEIPPEPTPEEILANLPIMTYEEYMAANVDDPVAIEAYVQAHQSWWDNKITVYAADEDGAYFIYDMACSEEDAAKLTPGTKICVRGYKAEWSGEIEIVDATFTFVEGDTYVAEPTDVTELLGADELIDYQNQLVSFEGLFVKSIEYKGGEPGDDIYLTVTHMGADYDFCVERYLTGPDTDLYKTVQTLEPGDVINAEGFLYWYEGVNTHLTAVEVVDTLTYAEYDASEINDLVVVEAYVQAHQSWWNNQVTVYAADEDGAYFLYDMACTEDDAAKLTAGAKIKVVGYKAEWSGEIEIVDCHFVFVEGDTYVATAKDLTDKLGTDELVKYQNQLVVFNGMTVKSIEYKGGEPGDDIYVTLTYGEADYSFCVERYLTGPETDLYKTVQQLQAGDVVDVEGFLYWYEGPNTHITDVKGNG